MRVHHIETVDTPRGAYIRAPVDWEVPGVHAETLEFLYVDTPASSITGAPDAVLAALLYPALGTSSNLTIEVPVSERLLNGVRVMVDVWTGWNPSMRRISVEAPVVQRPPAEAGEVGALFSCGVDSFYTVLRQRSDRDSIDTLVTVHGYDTKPSDTVAYEFLRSKVERVGQELKERCLFVETNAGLLADRFIPWSLIQGGMLIACALGAASRLRRCYHASTLPYRYMKPWGSHPFLDPLWSTESMDIVHDGAELARFEKVYAIADSDLALDTLRVCNYELGNCRRCSTCLITMLALDAAGALERSKTLGPDLPLDELARHRLNYGFIQDWDEFRAHVKNPKVRRLVDRVVRRAKRRKRYVAPLGRALRRARFRPAPVGTGPLWRGTYADRRR